MPLNITIIGLDQLGASLGLTLGTLDQQALPTGRPVITGWDSTKRTLRDARDRLMIDREAQSIADAVAEADVVFVTEPPDRLPQTFEAIAPHLRHGAVVTDVSSVKAEALRIAHRFLPTTVDFIGGHPLVNAPGEQRGATVDLFKGAIYCLVPGVNAHPASIDTLAALVTVIGAKPYYIDADEHDSYIAGVQHLPMLLSAALLDTIGQSGGWRDMQALSGDAFALATQFANIDGATASATLAANRAAIAQRLDDLIRSLQTLRTQLDDPAVLAEYLRQAHDMHTTWQAAQPNMRPGETEFYGTTTEMPSRNIGGLLFGQRKKRDR